MVEPSTPSSQPLLPKSDQNLVWLDCEMTGLEPERCIPTRAAGGNRLAVHGGDERREVVEQCAGLLGAPDRGWSGRSLGRAGAPGRRRGLRSGDAAGKYQEEETGGEEMA